MKQIPIWGKTGGTIRNPEVKTIGYAAVDDEYFDYLNQFRWIYLRNGKGGAWYPIRVGKGSQHIFLHKEVARLAGWNTKGQIDHNDRNTSNCLLSNLRPADYSQNHANKGLQKNSTSGFKGVSWVAVRAVFMASIKHHRKTIYLGYSKFASIAALLYDAKALKLFGPFAQTNQALGLLLPVEAA